MKLEWIDKYDFEMVEFAYVLSLLAFRAQFLLMRLLVKINFGLHCLFKLLVGAINLQPSSYSVFFLIIYVSRSYFNADLAIFWGDFSLLHLSGNPQSVPARFDQISAILGVCGF